MSYTVIIEWISEKWAAIAVPLVVFLAFVVVSIWARRRLYNYLKKVFTLTKWEGSGIFLNTTRTSCFQWCLILGGYTAIQISELSPYLKSLSGRLFGSIFIVSLSWTIITLVNNYFVYTSRGSRRCL